MNEKTSALDVITDLSVAGTATSHSTIAAMVASLARISAIEDPVERRAKLLKLASTSDEASAQCLKTADEYFARAKSRASKVGGSIAP